MSLLSFYFGRKGSFSSSEMCGVYYSVSLSTSCGGGRGAHLLVSVSPSTGRGSFASSTCVSLYLGGRWGQGSFASSTMSLPLGGVGGAHLHHPQCVFLYQDRGGAHLQHPQSMCLPLAWVEIGEHLQYPSQCITLRCRWGRGSFFTSSTVLLPLL